MLNDFLTALMLEMVRFLAKHPDFFKGSAGEREKALDSVRLASSFKHYLAHRDADGFMADLQLVVGFMHNPKSVKLDGNALFKAVLEFFTGPFATKIDQLSSDFYGFKENDQWTVVEELIKSDTRTAQALKELLVRRTYQELSAGLVELSQRVVGATYVVVQTPREVTPVLKKEMRDALTEECPLSFPVFQINKKLIGGLRVFKGGSVNDHSWLSRVHSFTSLSN